MGRERNFHITTVHAIVINKTLSGTILFVAGALCDRTSNPPTAAFCCWNRIIFKFKYNTSHFERFLGFVHVEPCLDAAFLTFQQAEIYTFYFWNCDFRDINSEKCKYFPVVYCKYSNSNSEKPKYFPVAYCENDDFNREKSKNFPVDHCKISNINRVRGGKYPVDIWKS